MAVIDTETIEQLGKSADVCCHMLPKPGIIRRTSPISKFDTVAPNDDLTTQIRFGWKKSKVLQRICIPDPPVVGDRIDERVSIRRRGKPGEISFN